MESSVSIPMEMVPQYPIETKVSMLDVDVKSLHKALSDLGEEDRELYNSFHGDGTRSRGKSVHQLQCS